MKNILNNKLFYLASSLVLAIGFSSCSSDDDQFMEVSTGSVTVEYNGKNVKGEDAMFEVGTNTTWTATCDEDWVTLSTNTAAGGRTQVYLTVSENSNEYRRKAIITVMGAGVSKDVSVIQNWKNWSCELHTKTFTVAKSGFSSNGDKEMFIEFETNDDWELSNIPDWIKPETLQGDRGYGYVSIKMLVDENTTGANRTGKITLKSGKFEGFITVNQFNTTLAVNPSDLKLEVDLLGRNLDGDLPTIAIESGTVWGIDVSGDWIKPAKMEGKAGTFADTEMEVLFGINETGATRKGKITITTADNFQKVIEVTQLATSYINEDNRPAGYMYFGDNFDWCMKFKVPYGLNDPFTDRMLGGFKGIYAADDIKAEFDAVGYKDATPASKAIYIAESYLRIGKSGHQPGIILPAQDFGAGKSSYVKVTFDWAPLINQTKPNGKIDATEMCVEIKGPGWIDKRGNKISETMTHSVTTNDNKWTKGFVQIMDITSDTEIIIRPVQQGKAGMFRYYLDNIKMERIKSPY